MDDVVRKAEPTTVEEIVNEAEEPKQGELPVNPETNPVPTEAAKETGTIQEEEKSKKKKNVKEEIDIDPQEYEDRKAYKAAANAVQTCALDLLKTFEDIQHVFAKTGAESETEARSSFKQVYQYKDLLIHQFVLALILRIHWDDERTYPWW